MGTAAGGNSSTMTMILYFVVFFGIMYFLMIRPQQKQKKQRETLLNSLQPKDKVMTSSGIYGKIVRLRDNTAILQIADKVEIEIAKSAISTILNRDTVIEKDKKAEKMADVETVDVTPEADNK